MKLCCSRNTSLLRTERYLLQGMMLMVLLVGSALTARAQPRLTEIDIAARSLSEALQQLSKQTELQLLYEQDAVDEQRAIRVRGSLSIDEALARLLKDSGLRWRFITPSTVAITALSVPAASAKLSTPVRGQRAASRTNDIAQLSDVDVTESRYGWVNTSSNTSFGFDKPLLETPRSSSMISGEAIEAFSLTAVEDLLRVVPGVFTTTRFGVQGSVDIRNVPADTYFRGMKRITLQGHGRSVLAAMDSIEVVGGPASPLFGIGKLGGYTNVVPKSGRARSGRYLGRMQGFGQLIGGQYERREVSFGLGGPLHVPALDDVQGGYYVYGLIEDSGSYAEGVPVKQKVLQAATSVDDVLGPFRLETGASYQESRTAGALTGRLTQALVERDVYVGGSPLVNLDLNRDGTIGYLEMQQASPVTGRLTNNNQPLNQVFAWPLDANGKPLPLEQFPRVPGIPQSMFNYLNANPEADPTGALRAQGVGGPVPLSGAVPVGMVLDPRTTQATTFNPRHSAAFENDLKAEFTTAFIDFIYDQQPDFTIKNQLFFDSMQQYKSSNQPFSQIQDVTVIEDKLTITRRLPALSWLNVNALMSLNARRTVSTGKQTFADYGNHRTDATSPSWNADTAGMTANTTFTSSNEDNTLSGLPWGNVYRTQYSELGAGLLFDVDLFTDTNLLLGVRHDGSAARNTDYAGRFNINTGTSAIPGAYLHSDDTAEAWDADSSWSISVSHQLPWGLRPYFTVARASIMLDGNNNSLTNVIIRAGHVGAAKFKELGVKGSWFNDRLYAATAVYEQGRDEVDETFDPAVLNTYATATTTRGWQSEVKWVPTDNLVLSLYALKQVTRYTPNIGGTIQVDARALGFADVVDANGTVIYPAEAFLYGGRARIVLPNGLKQYERKQGNPEDQIGLTAIYQFNKHWGMTFKGNYLSSTCSGRLCLVKLPDSRVIDLGLFWTGVALDLKLDVNNVTNERYFRARTGDTLGDVIAQAMPGRRWQATARYRF